MSSPSPYGQRPIPKKRFYGGPTIVSAVRVGSVGQGAPTAAAPPLASSSASTSSASSSSSSSSSSASTPLQPYLRQRSRDLSAAAAAAAAAPVKLPPPPPPPPQPPTPPPSSSLREATPATSASRFSSSPSSWMPTAAISRQPSSSGGGSSCDGDQPTAEREASRASPGAARRLQGGAEGLQLRHQTHAASSHAAAESVAEQLASRRADDDVTRAVEGAARKMEIERLAAEARAAVEQRAAEDAARKAEQERQAERDAARAAADEAERQAAMDRLAAETRAAEEARVAAEEAMRRLEQQRLAEREAAEEAAREAARVEAARQAEESRRAAEARALEAEAARRAAEEAMRRAEQQLREEREAAEEAARAAADEAARKVEAERLAAEARTVAAEEARRAAEEAMRKAEQERQAEREAAEEAARAAAEDAERQAALDRLAAETRAAEEARVAAEEAMRRVEQQRIAEREAAEEAAREAARVEAARQAEESRRAAEARALEADIARQDAVKAAQRAEQQLQEEREAAEEAARAAADEAARKVEAERLAAEARTAAAEQARRAAEEAMRKAEQERQAEREAARAAAEEAERQAAMDRLAAETRAAEEARMAAEEAKRRVEQQLQEEREAAEEAARAAADEVARKVEAERLAAEARTVAAEEARRAAEEAVRKAEQERQAEREAARAAAEDAERQAAMDRLAAETRAAEEARQAAEEAMRRAEQQLLEEREAAEEAARAAADEAARKVEAERLAAEARTAAAEQARRAAEEAMRKAEQERQAEREAARAAAEEAARQAALDRLAAETRAAEEARQAAEEAMQRIEQQRLAEREAAEEAAREAARVEAARQAEESRRAAEARALEAEAARRAAEEAMRRAEQQLREEREAAEEAARAAADEAARKVEAERLAAEARTVAAEEARRAAEEAMRKAEQERQAEREAAEEAARRLAVERKDADRKAFVERRVAEAEVARVSAEAALRREARRADGRSDASEGGASATGRRRLRSEASAAGSRRSSRHSSRRGVVGVASSRSSSSARSSPQPSSRASSLSFVEATEARTLSTVRSSFPGRPHVRSAAAVLPAAASVSSVSAPAELLQLPQQRFDSHHRTTAAAAAATHNAPYADDSASLLRYDSVRTEVSMASEAVDEEEEGSCAAAASGSGVGGNDGDVLANTGGLNSSHGCMDAMLCDEEGDAASLDAHYEGGVDMDGDSLGCSNTAHSNSLLVVGPSPAGTPVRGERAAEERSVSEDHGSTLSLSRTGLGDTGTLVLTQNTAMVENLRTTTSSCAVHSAESTPASKTSEVAQSVPAIGTAEVQQQQQQQQEPAAAAKSDPAPSMLLGQNRGVTLSPPQSHFSATGHTEPCMLLTPEQVVAAIAEDWDREKQEDDDDDRDVQFSTRIKPAALDGFALGGAYPEDVSSSTLHSSDIGEIMARERQQPSGPSTPALACSVEVQSPTPPPDTPPPDALPSESVETAKPTPVELPATTTEAAEAAAAAATAEAAAEVAAAAAAVAAVAAVAEQPPADVLTEDAREAEPASPGQLPPAEEGTGEASSDGAPDAVQTKDSADPAVHADHESAPEETAEGAGAEDQPPADAVPEVDAIVSAAAAVATADAAAARAQLLQVDVAEVAASTSSSMEALPPLSPPRGQQAGAAAAAAANAANTSGETLFSPAASKDRVSCPSEDDEGGDGTLSRCVSVTGPSIENSSYCDREFLVTTNYTIASDLPLVFTKSEGGSDAADSQSVASAACSVPASPPAAAAPARAPFDDCSGGSGGTPPLDPLARVLELSSVQATNNDSSMKTTTPTGLFSDPETCDSTAVVRGGRSTMDGDSDTTESSALHPTPPTGSCAPPVEVADAQDVLPETPAAGKVEAAAPEAPDTVGTLASESSQSCPSGGPAVVQPETPAAARDADTTAVQCCDTDEQPSETQEELNAAAQPRIESSDSESDDAGSEAAQSDTSSAAGEAAPDSPASARESEPSARADTSLVAASPVVRCEGSDAASEGSEAEAECEVVALPAPKEIPSAFEEPSAEREEDDVEPVQATPPTSAAADGQSLAEPPVPQQPEEEDTQPASPEATEAADARSPSPSSSQSQSKSGEAKPVQPDVRPGTAEPLPSQASPFTIAPPPMPSLTDMQCDATYTESLPASPTSPGGPITPARGDRNKGSNPALSFTPSSPVHSSQKPTEEPEHKSVSLQELVQMYPANAFQQSRIRTLSCLSDAASETSHIGIQSGQNSQMTIWGTVLRQTGSQCLKGSEDDNGSDCIGQLSPRTEKTLDAPGSSDNTDIDVDAHVDTLNASLSASQHTMATSTTGSSTSSASRHAGSEPPHEEPGPQRAAGSPSPPPPAAPTVPLLRTHDVINRQEAIAAAAVQPSYADFIGLNITPASPREEKPRRMVATPGKIAPVPQAPRSPSTSPTPASPSLRRARAHSLSAASTESYESRSPLSGTILAARQALGRGSHKEVAEALGNVVDQVQQSGPTNPFAQRLLQDLSRSTSNVAPTPESITLAPSKTKTQAMALSMLEEHLRLIDEGYDEYDDEDDEEDEEDELSADYGEAEDLLEPMTLCFKGGRDVVGAKATKAAEQYDSVMPGCENYCYTVKLPPATPMPLDIAKHLAETGRVDPSSITTDTTAEGLTELTIRHGMMGPDMLKETLANVVKDLSMDDVTIDSQDGCQELVENLIDWYTDKPGDLVTELTTNLRFPPAVRTRQQKKKALAKISRSMEDLAKNAGINAVEAMVLRQYTQKPMDLDRDLGWSGVPMPPANDRDLAGKICVSEYEKTYCDWDWSQHMMDPQKRNGSLFGPICAALRDQGPNGTWSAWSEAVIRKWIKWLMCIAAVTLRTTPEHLDRTLYRGLGAGGLPLHVVLSHRCMPRGSKLTWPALSSLSYNNEQSTAYMFGRAANSTNKPNPEKPGTILFAMKGVSSGLALASLSQYPEEDELLLGPLITFEVDEVKEDRENPFDAGLRINLKCVGLLGGTTGDSTNREMLEGFLDEVTDDVFMAMMALMPSLSPAGSPRPVPASPAMRGSWRKLSRKFSSPLMSGAPSSATPSRTHAMSPFMAPSVASSPQTPMVPPSGLAGTMGASSGRGSSASPEREMTPVLHRDPSELSLKGGRRAAPGKKGWVRHRASFINQTISDLHLTQQSIATADSMYPETPLGPTTPSSTRR